LRSSGVIGRLLAPVTTISHVGNGRGSGMTRANKKESGSLSLASSAG
jgi:hypothetical protein